MEQAEGPEFSYVEILSEETFPALKRSVRSLRKLQEEKYIIDGEMALLEQNANNIINNLGSQIGFILSFSGAWIFYQHMQLSCAVVGWITFIPVSCLIGGLGIAIWAARLQLRRMIPSVQSLDLRRKALAERAQPICRTEEARLEDLNTVDGVDNGALHRTVKCKTVIMQSKMIANSERYLSRFERYNLLFIWAAIICVVVNGAGICCIAYYTYCHADVLGCKNPMMPPQITKIYNLPEESAYMCKYDGIQKVPQVSLQTNATLGDRGPESCPGSINSSEVAPHLVRDMPLLSPTMVITEKYGVLHTPRSYIILSCFVSNHGFQANIPYTNEDANFVELASKCLQYEARYRSEITFIPKAVEPPQKQEEATSRVLMDLTKTPVVLPTILSPLGKACAKMDLTAVHDILLKTGYKNEDGAENEGKQMEYDES